jgi:hypothetical protein
VAEPVRYDMDQHLPNPASQGPRRHGRDALTAQEAGLCGLPDADQLTFATADGRVLVTFETDSLALRHRGPRCRSRVGG